MKRNEEILITVIMPIFNMMRFLGEAVESVLHQTYTNFELLLIDDCSTDGSLAVARKYAAIDSRVRVISFSKNQGVANVRNRGIMEAKGAYIALLDSDDVWMPDKLQLQLDRLQTSAAQIAYCSYDFTNEQGQIIQKPFIVPESTDYKHMLTKSVISCSTALIDAELLKKHPFVSNHYHEDFILWMELLSQPGVEAVGCQEVLTHYRQVPGSRSNNKKNAAWHRWKIYRESLGMSLFSSSLAFALYAYHAVVKYYF